MLTKSNYLSAHQCKKRIWLDKKSDILIPVLNSAEQKRVYEGNAVGERARLVRGNGVFIKSLNWDEALVATEQAIANGATQIFEAAFCFENKAVRVDVLEKEGESWNLFEVKASTKLKKEHIPDIAFQKYVVENAGQKIAKASLMLINKSYRKGQESELFVYINVDKEIAEYSYNLEAELNLINKTLKSDSCPEVHVSRHCKKPNKCSYYAHCWKEIPKKSIFTIPRLTAKNEKTLISTGNIEIKNIPKDIEFSDNQKLYIDSVICNKSSINKAGLKQELNKLEFPIYFFDVECAQSAIPVFEEVAPYTQLCFQFSCHVLHENGELSHHEFLHTATTDPRGTFLKSLLEVIKDDNGSVVVYNKSFEIGRIREFIEWFSEHKEVLDRMIDRVWDQMAIFKDFYMHPDFNGSISIKNVLPVIVPELSYEQLEISQGDEASAVWSKMICLDESDEKSRLSRALLEYCKLDTLAMVEIHRKLIELKDE